MRLRWRLARARPRRWRRLIYGCRSAGGVFSKFRENISANAHPANEGVRHRRRRPQSGMQAQIAVGDSPSSSNLGDVGAIVAASSLTSASPSDTAGGEIAENAVSLATSSTWTGRFVASLQREDEDVLSALGEELMPTNTLRRCDPAGSVSSLDTTLTYTESAVSLPSRAAHSGRIRSNVHASTQNCRRYHPDRWSAGPARFQVRTLCSLTVKGAMPAGLSRERAVPPWDERVERGRGRRRVRLRRIAERGERGIPCAETTEA